MRAKSAGLLDRKQPNQSLSPFVRALQKALLPAADPEHLNTKLLMVC